MFGKQYTMFKLLGFKVQVDTSWFLLVALVIWTLAVGYFPYEVHGLPTSTYWLMGIAGAIGLFLSIVLHELSHSVVARRRGLPMKGITLFIFGGVAHMDREPPSAGTEFLMAVAGPAASVVLAGLFFGAYEWGRQALPAPILLVLGYLAFINALLAAFNLIPAFPLDGGRIFRAILWSWKHNLRWATRVASLTGSGFAIAFIGVGAFDVLAGNFIGGFWLALIGLFLYGASGASYRQLVSRQLLEGESVQHLMVEETRSVGRQISIKELVEDYIYRYHIDLFPVTDGSRLIGCVGTQQVKTLPREEWERHSVGELAVPCSSENTIEVSADAAMALSVMNRTGHHRLLVRDGDRLVGVITQKDMLKYLSLKLELGSSS